MKSKKSLIVLAVVGVWYLAVVLLSAFRPPHDTVAVGIDVTLKTPAAIAKELTCNTLFSGEPVQTPLPTLKAMPDGVTPLAYVGEPCVTAHHDARSIFVFDTIVVLVVGVGVVGWNVRGKRPRQRPRLGTVSR